MRAIMSKAAAVTASQARIRRTQQERSAAMRLRLLDAAVDCLHDLGYSGTTTIEVAARAGVSRGAQLHHFPTKDKLVTEAVRHILAKRLEEFRAAFAQLPEGADRAGAALDIVWQKLSGKVFYAWLELVVASRTDPALHQAVVEIAGQFLDQVQATTRENFRAPSDALFPLEMAPALAFAAMQGLALDRIMWPSDDGRLDEALKALRSLAAVALRAHDAPKSSATLGS
jgi:AcrR family transcriptional regulator